MRNGRRRLGVVRGNGSEPLPPSGDDAAGGSMRGLPRSPASNSSLKNEPRSTFHA